MKSHLLLRAVPATLALVFAWVPGALADPPAWYPVPGDSTFPFAGEASVTPTSAPIGAPLEFRFTVTNTSSERAEFSVGGCPVFVIVDGVYSPVWACPEFIRQIVLEPGECCCLQQPQAKASIAHRMAQRSRLL